MSRDKSQLWNGGGGPPRARRAARSGEGRGGEGGRFWGGPDYLKKKNKIHLTAGPFTVRTDCAPALHALTSVTGHSLGTPRDLNLSTHSLHAYPHSCASTVVSSVAQ